MNIKEILNKPYVFNLFNRMLGDAKSRIELTEKYIQPKKGDKILDIGCGTGTTFPYLGEVEYDGYDGSKEYIEYAKSLFSKNANFYHEYVETHNLKQREYYDIVLAFGLIHHIDNQSCDMLLTTAYNALKTGGKFITFDNILVENQSRIARWIILNDRGKYIREEMDYKNLFNKHFKNVRFDIRTDFLLIPYTHIIAVATKD